MNRHSFIAGLMVAVLGSSVIFSNALAQEASLADEAMVAITAAEEAVEEARAAIEKGKELVVMIPEDSPLMPDVAQVLQAASENWTIAVDSLKGAKESAAKVATASNESVAKDYALLAKVNAGVALSGAKVVQIGITYIDAIANNKVEALDIIRTAMQDALAASSQVQFNYERVKTLIAEKYSK
jgi:hypothetical protein